jgi:predicted RNA-binding protein YlxR (DUF448 family)
MHRCVLTGGVARVDPTGSGRGAWICDVACLERAVARRGFDRAWRASAPATVGDDLARGLIDATVLTGSARHERMTTRVKG